MPQITHRTGEPMNKKFSQQVIRAFMMALVALALTSITWGQDNVDVKFKGGIGVIPVTAVAANGAVKRNIVRGINPAGHWRVADLQAVVESNGHIRVRGRALLLAAGNGIGTSSNASVHATPFCGAANAA